MSAFRGTHDVLALLIQNQADVNSIDDFGSATLHYLGIFTGVPSTVKLVLDSRGDINIASQPRSCKIIALAAMSKAASCFFATVSETQDFLVELAGSTPLLLAALYGRTDMIKLLLDANADVKKVNSYPKSAIELARASRNATTVQML